MSPEELERMLRRWGREFGQRPGLEWDEDSSAEFGGSTTSVLQRMHVGADAPYVPKLQRQVWIDPKTGAVVPMHIPGMDRVTARGRESKGTAPQWNASIESERVEIAALALYSYHPLRGVVLRIEYCTYGYRHREKARMVSACEGIEEHIPLRRYRHELDYARQFMAGKLHLGSWKVA